MALTLLAHTTARPTPPPDSMDARARALETLMGAGTADPTTQPPPGMRYVKTCGAECGKDERTAKMLSCQACLAVVYCSKECQKQDWKRHKPECSARAEATATLAGEGITYVQQRKSSKKRAAREETSKVCCLCRGSAGKHGHNPHPLAAYPAVCCDSCNITRVIPARFAATGADEKAGSVEAARAAVAGSVEAGRAVANSAEPL